MKELPGPDRPGRFVPGETMTDPPTVDVLLVDDDIRIIDVLAELLGDTGLRVATAMSPEEGLDMFDRLSPAVVVSDYDLQRETNGIDLLSGIAERRPDIRRVLISGMAFRSDIQAAVAAGVAHQVRGKSDFEAIVDAVRNEAEQAGIVSEF